MSQDTYARQMYLPAWTVPNAATLVPVMDVRPNDFGVQLLTAFKQYARITYNYDDNLLPTFIDAAIRNIEHILEFPILPASFSWDVGQANIGFEAFEVPIRNSDAVGQSYDVNHPRAFKLMLPPAAWPVTLVVGYSDATAIPQDLLMVIFATATSYEQLRGVVELGPAHIPPNLLAKYLVMRC